MQDSVFLSTSALIFTPRNTLPVSEEFPADEQPPMKRDKSNPAAAGVSTPAQRAKAFAITTASDALSILITNQAYDDVDSLKRNLFLHAATMRNIISLICVALLSDSLIYSNTTPQNNACHDSRFLSEPMHCNEWRRRLLA